jgi:uncharacterized protein YuzE
MRFTYDLRYNIAYIRFHDKQADVESVRISDEMVVDMAHDGTIYGIALLNANEQLRDSDKSDLLVINEATGEQAMLSLGFVKQYLEPGRVGGLRTCSHGL